MHGHCDFPGCKDASKCRPVIIVTSDRPPVGIPQPVFLANVVAEDRYIHQLECLCELCSYHQGTFDLKHYMTEETWGAIDNHAEQLGYQRPNRDNVRVSWVPAAGPDGLDDEGRAMRDVLHGFEHTPERREKLLKEAYGKGAKARKVLLGG